MKPNRSERGQAVVLIALALVAMFGFAALAIDGGRVFSEKRRAQNAADSAAYAAASAAVDSLDWEQAGLDQAIFNAYNDADAGPNPDQDVDVMIYHPPVDGPYAGNNQYYQAKIRNRLEQVFSQVVYPNGLEIAAEAVAYARPSGPMSPGDAIIALAPHACQAIKAHGNGKVKVNGGNINSKSDATPPPTSCDSFSLEGGGNSDPNLIVTDGNVIAAGSANFPTGELQIINGSLMPFTTTPAVPVLPEPDCSHLTTRSYSGGSATLYPGVYPNGIKITGNNTVVNMMPGMYCLDGGANGGLVMTGGRLTANRVFFDVRQGSVSITGGTLELSSAKSILDGANPPRQWGGMLFYMPYNNTGEINIVGNGDAIVRGTIYAPGPRSPESKYKCVFEGVAGVFTLNSSIYCYSITVGGTHDVVVDYKEKQNYQMAPFIELAQ